MVILPLPEVMLLEHYYLLTVRPRSIAPCSQLLFQRRRPSFAVPHTMAVPALVTPGAPGTSQNDPG